MKVLLLDLGGPGKPAQAELWQGATTLRVDIAQDRWFVERASLVARLTGRLDPLRAMDSFLPTDAWDQGELASMRRLLADIASCDAKYILTPLLSRTPGPGVLFYPARVPGAPGLSLRAALEHVGPPGALWTSIALWAGASVRAMAERAAADALPKPARSDLRVAVCASDYTLGEARLATMVGHLRGACSAGAHWHLLERRGDLEWLVRTPRAQDVLVLIGHQAEGRGILVGDRYVTLEHIRAWTAASTGRYTGAVLCVCDAGQPGNLADVFQGTGTSVVAVSPFAAWLGPACHAAIGLVRHANGRLPLPVLLDRAFALRPA